MLDLSRIADLPLWRYATSSAELPSPSDRQSGFTGGPLLFSTSADGARAVVGFSHSKLRVVNAMNLLAAGQAGVIAPWRLHDLRRTAGTGMASVGVPVSTISRILNHSEGARGPLLRFDDPGAHGRYRLWT